MKNLLPHNNKFMDMSMHNIGLDIDGVIANFQSAWHELHPEIPAEPDTYDSDKNFIRRFDEMREAGTLNDFYLSIKPLLKPEDVPFKPCCYVTARPVETCVTKQWLDAYGFPKKRVITVPTSTSKVEAMKEAGVKIFIDDHYGNFTELNDAGILCYLYTASWNIKYDVGDMRLNSLKDLLLFV